MKAAAILLAIAATASAGCALRPLYADGRQGAVASQLAAISVPAIEGKAGWLLRNALTDRLGSFGESGARYRLDIRLDDRLEGLGALRDDTVTRERRTLRARYQLVEQGSGRVLLDATAGSDAGIDVVSSEYAVIAAEDTALENLAEAIADQIVTRIALNLGSGDAQP